MVHSEPCRGRSASLLIASETVPLSIGSSRPLRTHRELTALVDAIAQASVAEPETHSVEWKSTFDLRNSAEHRFELGKHILGFGNRAPDRAAGEFSGCAYLVLGAEPQAVPGVPAEDPADLDNWITPYVGADGPQWSVDYVQSNGQDVLIVTVEAPVWGDDIYTLGKGFGTFLAGQIFVRRGGKTVQPDPSEVRMLQERAKRSSSRIALEVGLCDPATVLTTFTAASEHRANWINSESIRLYGPLQARRRTPSRTPFEALMPDVVEDYRGIQGYEADVQEYLGRAGERWQSLVLEVWSVGSSLRCGSASTTRRTKTSRQYNSSSDCPITASSSSTRADQSSFLNRPTLRSRGGKAP